MKMRFTVVDRTEKEYISETIECEIWQDAIACAMIYASEHSAGVKLKIIERMLADEN